MRNLLLAACGLAILAATPASAAPDRVCIRQDDIRNWTALNDKSIVLENYHHQKALLQLIGTCSGFKFHDTLDIRSPGATGLSCVQVGDSIVTHDGIGGRCAVSSVTAYTGPAKPTDPPHSGY
jgi:hypothetical protein